jgi:uncharacterized membrane protein YhaH (DUF805 family)
MAAMDWRYLLDSFDGRISRKTFWIAIAVVGVGNFLGCYVAELIEGVRLSAVVDLVFTYPEFAIAVKRAHDRDLPAWLVGVLFVSSLFLDFMDVQGWSGTAGQPSILMIAVALPATILFFALLVELGFRVGTPGPNQHGPDPLRPDPRSST